MAQINGPKQKRGRPKLDKEATARAIYFRDATTVEELSKQISGHPRASLSSVVQQLLGQFVKSYRETPPVDNKLTFTANVYL